MPNNNVSELSTTDVATDLVVRLDGHVVEHYFDDGSAISYEAIQRPSGDGVDLIAIDAEGNKRTFTLDVTDAG
jgi:hypothetical protein